MRSKAAFLMADLIFSKDPHSNAITPWHHDQPYGWYDGPQVCQFWIPLDRVDLENGTLELVKGSHRWDKWFKIVSFDGGEFDMHEFEDLPDIDGNRDDYDVVSFEMDPGDCI